MIWHIVFSDSAVEDLLKLSPEIRKAIVAVIEKKLSFEPEKYGKYLRKKLKEYMKLKVMDYRVIYRVEKGLVTVFVVAVGPRRNDEVYLEAEKRLK